MEGKKTKRNNKLKHRYSCSDLQKKKKKKSLNIKMLSISLKVQLFIDIAVVKCDKTR